MHYFCETHSKTYVEFLIVGCNMEKIRQNNNQISRRNKNLDRLKLTASIFVVTIHVLISLIISLIVSSAIVKFKKGKR